MSNMVNTLLIFSVLMFILGCGGETKIEETASGRLKYIETLKYGAVGTHGSKGWYVADRDIKVKGYSWTPPDVKLKDLGRCEPTPNTSGEALKCNDFNNMKETIHLLRIKNEQPEWTVISSQPYDKDDSGEWTGGGRWLMFRDHFLNIETDERKPIKQLPHAPREYFLDTSPDLKTIVYAEFCFDEPYDQKTGALLNSEGKEKVCTTFQDRMRKGFGALWLIDAETGKYKILELKKADYAPDEPQIGSDWLRKFIGKIVWEKDAKGEYQVKYPK